MIEGKNSQIKFSLILTMLSVAEIMTTNTYDSGSDGFFPAECNPFIIKCT